ncbi:MAG TPA: pilus assembly protein PilP [Polyangiaceae bacterium]|nr:pilus assembly protein PilP [Polyangiaceae bacterium]
MLARKPLRVLAWLAIASLGASLGCEAKVVKSGSKAAASASAGPLSPAASAASKGSVAKMDIAEGEFTETERSRDPFRTFARRFVEESRSHARSQREVLLAQYSVDELKLIGIVTRIQPAKAMLVDPTGKGTVVQRGQFVGRADVVQTTGRSGATYEINWRVDRIRDSDVVLVREDPSNPDVPTATKVIPLRPDGSLVGKK